MACLQDLIASSVAGRAHAIPLHGSEVEVLESPDHFFQALLTGLATAKHSITIATLYIGTGDGHERQFVNALASAAHDTSRPHLRVQLLLDALRSTRPTPGISGQPTSTAGLLAETLLASQGRSWQELEAEGPGTRRVTVSLFHTPALRGLLRSVLPARVREVVGVCHTKLYLFDNDVLLSGANISGNYLTNRQDRYLLIRNAPQLADFLRCAVDRVSALSYQLQPETAATRGCSVGMNAKGLHGTHGTHGTSTHQAGGHLQSWLPPAAKAQTPDGAPGYTLGPCPAGVDPVRHALAFNRNFRDSMSALFVPSGREREVTDVAALELELAEAEQGWHAGPPGAAAGYAQHSTLGTAGARAAPSSAAPGWQQPLEQGQAGVAPPDTWIVPLCQAGFAGLRQEERCTAGLLATAAAMPRSLLQLSTPYLNLARPYEWQLRQAWDTHLELLTSSPEANGFFGSRGISGYIPLAYSTLEHRTWLRLTGQGGLQGRVHAWQRRAAQSGRDGGGSSSSSGGSSSSSFITGDRRLLEYARPGWEFHAKGLWFAQHRQAAPMCTAVGSSNFGFRSLHRDLEINFLVFTSNQELQERLAEEWRSLARHAVAVGSGAHFMQPGRRAGLVGRAAVRMLRGLL